MTTQPRGALFTYDEILGAVARGWTTPANEAKTVDPVLAEAIAHEIQDLLSAGAEGDDNKLPEPFPRVHSYDPSGARRTVTVQWGEESFVSYVRYGDRSTWKEIPPINETPVERPAPSAGVGPSAEAAAALRFVYDHFCGMDDGDEPLEKYPQRAVDALARAGWAVVPCGLPFAVLGEAAKTGMLETGNPKHIWEWLIAKTRIYPFCAIDASIEVPGEVDTRALSHALNCLGLDAKTNTPDFELAEQLAAQMRRYRGESARPAPSAGVVEFDPMLIADMLRQFGDALNAGELDGAGRYRESAIYEQADLIEASVGQAVTAPASAAGEGMLPIIEITGVDEYGPILGWHKHWAGFPVGTKFARIP